MTLSKQLFILISALFLMIFSVNFVISVGNMRSYLQIEAEVHAQDTATSLGLALSPYISNETDPVMETMMNAIFDMGYYKELKLVNAEGRPLVTLTNDQVFEEVPGWFIAMLPIETATAKSEISSGWSIGGTLRVTVNPGYAYLKLYHQAQSAFYYSMAAFIASSVLLMLVLRFILLPLKRISQLALAVSDGQYETMDRLPWTTEVRTVAGSMNAMSKKIGEVVTNLNAKLELLGKKLQLDDVTGLSKKCGFETDMKRLLAEHGEAFIYLIKLDGLAAMAKEKDSEAIDRFLRDCANSLKQLAATLPEGSAGVYHFFGGEFVLLARDINSQQVEQMAKALSRSLGELGSRYRQPDIAHIGVAPFNPLDTTAGMLAAANEAFEQAKLIGANSYFIRTRDDQAKDIAEWKSLVFDVVDNDAYTVSFIDPIESFLTGQVLMTEAFIRASAADGQPIPVGTFVSVAEKFEKIVDLDKGVVEKVLAYIEGRRIRHAIAVNVSTRTVKNSDFRAWLAAQLARHQAVSAQLVFSISAYAVAKEVKVFKEFIKFVHEHGAKVILKRFDTQSVSLETAKALRPDYIRMARDLGNGVSREPGKRDFIEAMKEMGQLLDIGILAENIDADEDFAAIKAMGIAGASRGSGKQPNKAGKLYVPVADSIVHL